MSTIDYARMNTEGPKLKRKLTLAQKKTGLNRRDAVLEACRVAVATWDSIGAWPDNWSHWQRALDDVYPIFTSPDLRELRANY